MIWTVIEIIFFSIITFLIFRLYLENNSHLMFMTIVVSVTCNILVEIVLEISKNSYINSANDNYSNFSIILWWTPILQEQQTMRKCYNKNCIFTNDRKVKDSQYLKVIIFYGTKINLTDLPLFRRTEMWALFHEESPRNAPFLLNENFFKLFNYTSTFSRHSHFPLYNLYVDSLNSLINTKYYIGIQEKNKLLQSIAPVLYIQSNCDTLTNRDAYVNELRKYIHIDSYGKCLNNAKLPENLQQGNETDLDSEEFLRYVSRYKFTIAIENAACEDYITEKLWRSLIVGSVPIYYGSPTVRDWTPNFDSVILVSDFSSPQQLASYIRKLNEDDRLYEYLLEHKTKAFVSNKLLKKMIKSKKNLRRKYYSNNIIEEFECELCSNSYNSEAYTKYKVDKTHYNCSQPISILTGVRNNSNHWNDIIETGKCNGEAVYQLISANVTSYTMEDIQRIAIDLRLRHQC